MTKEDQSLFEKMDDEIVLDTNLLQSLATDLLAESDKVNKDVIGQIFADIFLNKLNGCIELIIVNLFHLLL